MKKYLSILLVLLFLVGVVSPTFAVGDAVTDEVKAEIEELLEKYNELTLLINHIEGSVEYIKDIEYVVPIEEEMETDEDGNPWYFNYGSCLRIVDDTFSSIKDIEELYHTVYTDRMAEIYLREELHASVPQYIEWDGFLYSPYDFSDSSPLCQRYVDIGSIEVSTGTKGMVVEADASSIIKSGKIGEPDSKIKLLIVSEKGKLKIERVRTCLFSQKSEADSLEGKIIEAAKNYEALKDILGNHNKELLPMDNRLFLISNSNYKYENYTQNDLFSRPLDNINYSLYYDLCLVNVDEDDENVVYDVNDPIASFSSVEGIDYFYGCIKKNFISQHEYIIPAIIDYNGWLYIGSDTQNAPRCDFSEYSIKKVGDFYYLYTPCYGPHTFEGERVSISVFKEYDLFGDGDLKPYLKYVTIDNNLKYEDIANIE
ncbi:MAG: hypothetical protein IJN75_05145 [Clostridia bacterium]|nr:hypothetical protein [Clostridia bacterium]